MDIKKIEQIIFALESKGSLTKSETFKLARYRVILKDPEGDKKRYKKMSETKRNKSVEQKTQEKTKRSNSLKKRWEEIKKDPEKLAEISRKRSIAGTGKKRSKESIKKQIQSARGKKMTGERLGKQRETNKKRIQKYGNKRKPSEWFVVEGIKCQGHGERKYIEDLIENCEPLPKRGGRIITPTGFYHPDFEFEDKYIEIKSLLTFDMLVGKRRDYNNIFCIDQLVKINFVAKNIKPVLIIFWDGYKRNEVLIDNDFDINTIIEDGREYESKPLLSKEERARIAKEVGLKQRGRKVKESVKNDKRKTIKKRKEENPELHKQIYEEIKKKKLDKWNSLSKEDQERIKLARSLKMKNNWEKMRNDPKKLKERNEKIGLKASGRKYSDEQKKVISENTKKQWENMSEEEKQRRDKRWQEYLRNREVTDEMKNKISESNKITKNKIKEENPELYFERIEKMKETKRKNK